jgi:hypothetical protein
MGPTEIGPIQQKLTPERNPLAELADSRQLQLIQPGSEWHLHREWYGSSAIGDLLGEEEAILIKISIDAWTNCLNTNGMSAFSRLAGICSMSILMFCCTT